MYKIPKEINLYLLWVYIRCINLYVRKLYFTTFGLPYGKNVISHLLKIYSIKFRSVQGVFLRFEFKKTTAEKHPIQG